MKATTDKTMVIGVGNTCRGDDAAGLDAAQRLAQMAPRITVRQHSGEGTSLMNAWQGAETVFVIDAVSSGAAPGTIFRFEAHNQPLPAGPFANCSTHAFGVAEAIEFARVLGQLPPRLLVYGIEGKVFAMEDEISTEVDQALETVVDEILQQVQPTPTSA